MVTELKDLQIEVRTATDSDIQRIQMSRRHFQATKPFPAPSSLIGNKGGPVCLVATIRIPHLPQLVIGGYLVYKRIKHRLELQSIAVLPVYRRLGIARALINSMFELLDTNVRCLSALVPEIDLPMQKLLKNDGHSSRSFRAVEIVSTHKGTFYRMVYHADRGLFKNRLTKSLGKKRKPTGRS